VPVGNPVGLAATISVSGELAVTVPLEGATLSHLPPETVAAVTLTATEPLPVLLT
jgi:hypothetical protein